MATEIESPMSALSIGESPSSRDTFSGLVKKSRRSRFKARRKAISSVFVAFRPSRTTKEDGVLRDVDDERILEIIVNALPIGAAEFEPQESPRTIEYCLELLEKPNIAENRKGLQMLSLLTRFKMRFASPASGSPPSHFIVHGGDNPTATRLRELLLTFLCDVDEGFCSDGDGHDSDGVASGDEQFLSTFLSDDDICSDDDGHYNNVRPFDESLSSNESFDSEDGDERPRGQHWGALHGPALRVITNCLEPMAVAKGRNNPIDFSFGFWMKIVGTLIENVEVGHSADISGYSLRCLRLLQSLEPDTVTPMLQYSLLPYLVHLKEYGELQNYPMIQDETSRLMKRIASFSGGE